MKYGVQKHYGHPALFRPGIGGDLMAKSKGSSRSSNGKFRSAISGKYVTAKYGKANPKKVVEERDRK